MSEGHCHCWYAKRNMKEANRHGFMKNAKTAHRTQSNDSQNFQTYKLKVCILLRFHPYETCINT